MANKRPHNMSPGEAQNAAKEHIQLYELYDGSQHAAWSQDTAKDIEFVNNVQYTVDVINALTEENQPVTINNEIKPIRDQVVGQLTANNPRWICTPVESSDAKLAGDINDLMEYIWDSRGDLRYNGHMHFRKAIEDFEDTGLFVLHAFFDPYADMGNGEIKLKRIIPGKWICDPTCELRNAQSADNQFLGDVLSESKIRSQYPDYDFKGAVPYSGDVRKYGTGSIQEGQVFQASFLAGEKYYRVIDRYQRIKQDMFKVSDPNSNFEKILTKGEFKRFLQQPAILLVKNNNQEEAVTEEVRVQMILQAVIKSGNMFFLMSDGSERAGTEETARIEVDPSGQPVYPIIGSTTMDKVVDMGYLLENKFIQFNQVPVDRIKRSLVIGEKLYREVVLPISNYPFAVTMLHHTDNPYCYGDTRLARSVQEQINKISSLIVAYNINIANIKAFIPRDGTLKKQMQERWGKAGAQFFEFDPDVEQPPVVVQLTAMSTAFYEQIDRLRGLLQRIYGAYDFQEAQNVPAPQTALGTMQLDEMGLRRSKSKLQLIEQALNDLGSVIAEMIPFCYTERKLIRILKPNNNEYKTVIFNEEKTENDLVKIENDLTINRYDIKMMSSSTLPSNMATKFNIYLRMFELQAVRDPAPLIRLSGLPDAEEIIQNENLINQAQQTIAQLQDSVKMLKGDLQTAQREKVHADQKVQLAKTKSDLDGLTARANAAVIAGQKGIQYAINDFKRQASDTLTKIKNSETSKSNGNGSESQGD